MSCQGLLTSPRAHTPSAVVRWCRSTRTSPLSSTSTPAASSPSRSELARLPVATSSTSASTTAPSSSAARTPSPCRSSRTTVRPGRRSQRVAAWSVNRSAISSSSWLSRCLERLTTVTAVPNAENTWANSADTKPPPMMSSRPGWRLEPHHGVAGAHVDLVDAGHVRQRGAGAGRDHDLVGGDSHAGPGVDRALGDEGGVPLEQPDTRVALGPVVPPALGDRVDAGEDPIPDRGPVRRLEAGADAEARGRAPPRAPRRRGGRTSWSGCIRR